eukprot:6519979-Prymnesium_polylepis.1
MGTSSWSGGFPRYHWGAELGALAAAPASAEVAISSWDAAGPPPSAASSSRAAAASLIRWTLAADAGAEPAEVGIPRQRSGADTPPGGPEKARPGVSP